MERCSAVKPVGLKAGVGPVDAVNSTAICGDDVPVPDEARCDFDWLHRYVGRE